MLAMQRKDQDPAPVPFMDLAAVHAPLQERIEERIRGIASLSSFVMGPDVERFEARFAEYCGVEFAVGCNSGTSAIHMALSALDIGPGDEVITVSHTFVGTVWGVLYCGATPVFVDVDAATMTMDVTQLEERISARTRAIVPVHLYGQAVDMDPLMSIARKHGLAVVEDAAQAHGLRYKGRPIGSIGDIGCFSFYPGKNLGAWGEAGATVTSDRDLAARMRRLRDHGQPQRYHHDELGFNYRMDSIQAAVLDVKLDYLDDWNRQRQVLADRYRQRLGGAGVGLPESSTRAEHVYHLFVIRHALRDRIRQELDQRAIQTGLHYPVPVHRQKVLTRYDCRTGLLSNTDSVARECLSLPLYPGMTVECQERVCESLLAAMDHLGP